jgi:hypothetical protein
MDRTYTKQSWAIDRLGMDAIPTEGKMYDLIEAASGDVLGVMNTDNEAKNTVVAKYVIEMGTSL